MYGAGGGGGEDDYGGGGFGGDEDEEIGDGDYGGGGGGGGGDRRRAKVMYDYAGGTPQELRLTAGTEIEFIADLGSGWYHGAYNGVEGVFPADYVQLL